MRWLITETNGANWLKMNTRLGCSVIWGCKKRQLHLYRRAIPFTKREYLLAVRSDP